MEKNKRTFAALVTESVTPRRSPWSKQKEILVPIDFSESSLSALRRELGSHVVTNIEVREGKPSVAIELFARQRQVDLIIIGRHQHHGLRQWFNGHTASRLSKNAPCPLLVLTTGHLN